MKTNATQSKNFSIENIKTGEFPSHQQVRAYLEEGKRWLQECQKEKVNGDFLVEKQTQIMDVLLDHLFSEAKKKRNVPDHYQASLLGIGGYGRKELCPFSDLDLLFLHEKKSDPYLQEIVEKMLYVLWDAGLDVSNAIRTIDECVELAKSDSREATSMLDARLVSGAEDFYNDLVGVLRKNIFSKKSLIQFLKIKRDELRQRHHKYGDSVYLLEPDIKNGRSGMRDFNTIDWILKSRYKLDPKKALRTHGLLTSEEIEEYYRAKELLFRLRFFLHFRAKRRQDTFDFESQKDVALRAGLNDLPKALAVEQMMQKYYLIAELTERYVESILYQIFEEEEKGVTTVKNEKRKKVDYGLFLHKNLLSPGSEDFFSKDPKSLIGIFRSMQIFNAKITPFVKRSIRRHLYLVNEEFRKDPEIAKIFLEMLNEPKELFRVLETCHRTGFLSAYIPEFRHLNCLVLHDLYHIYTVDTHLLFAIRELEKLAREKEPDNNGQSGLEIAREVLTQIRSFHILVLSVLFHDIGKGLGKGHSERGANLVQTIAQRLGLSKNDNTLLEQLVRFHLLMAHTAQRRDIHDNKQILEFCKTIKTPEMLRCLYLLTICDIRAVGPKVWTEWKGSLLSDLYTRSLLFFEKGEEELEKKRKDLKGRWKRVCERLPKGTSNEKLNQLYMVIPPRFLVVYRATEIAHFLKFVLSHDSPSLKGTPAFIQGRKLKEKGYFEVAIHTLDHPGLFTQLSGVLSANNLNIIGVETSTWSDGQVLDIFRVINVLGEPIIGKELLQKIHRELCQVLQGEKKVENLISRIRPSSGILKKPFPRKVPAQVNIDNDISEYYTVVEIFSGDRMGLLYDIAKVFWDHKLNIQTALISTNVDQVADVFYIKDPKGNKLGTKKSLNKLKEELLTVVETSKSG